MSHQHRMSSHLPLSPGFLGGPHEEIDKAVAAWRLGSFPNSYHCERLPSAMHEDRDNFAPRISVVQ